MHYCDFKVIKATNTAVIEVCQECKKKITTKTDKKGRMDNVAYLKEHVRDTAQKTGATAKIFKQFYGEGKG